MAISAKYVGDLNGAAQPVLAKYPMNNSKMSVGDFVTCKSTGNTDGYLDIAVTVKGALGVIQGFVFPDGRPITPANLPASATTTSTGPVCLDLTPNADGDAFALVSISLTAVYSVVVATAPTATTQYIGGGGDLTTLTSGGQKMEVVTAGAFAGKSLVVVPWNQKSGIDANDSTRLTVILHENELFSSSDTTD